MKAASPSIEKAFESAARKPLIALMGNPNTGKSTIFNRLTGLRQRVANYPGITIEARDGLMPLGDREVEILDLPGTYSLSATSLDEQVVVDVLTGHEGRRKPDLVVCVVDATNLKRNLFLASQLAEFGMPMLIVLNQWDGAVKRGLNIDLKELEAELGVPVLATVGTKGTGLAELRQAVADALESPRLMRRLVWRDCVAEAVSTLREKAAGHGMSLSIPEAQRILFDCGSVLRDRLAMPTAERDDLICALRSNIRKTGLNPAAAEAVLHYEHLDTVLSKAMRAPARPDRGGDESIDALLVHRIWGTAIFVAIMWVVFQSVYSWAAPFMDLIDAATGAAQEAVAPALASLPAFQSLIVDGVIGGVGGVVIFLPQIFILFLFIALLEDSGYMSRAAFLMDKLFGWCGLNGKSFVPLLSSYACAIPGIMAARSLDDPKARLSTILMAPFMSCSARLPVYVLLIGAFIEPTYGPIMAGWTLFAMHFVGLAVSLPLAWLMNRWLLKIRHQPFILEMSSYKIPDMRNVLLKMWEGGREFILRAGTVILAFSIIIWALLYFPRPTEVATSVENTFIASEADASGLTPSEIEARLADPESDLSLALANRIDGAYIEQSYLGRFGKFVQPVFAPAGFDWKITVGVISSFPAREVIIATLGIIYNMGADVDEESSGLRDRMAAETWESGPLAGEPVFSVPVVLAVMVFFALCMQCGATVAVMAKQIGWRWAAGSFFGMTIMAWAAAVIVFQTARLILPPA